MEILDIFIPSEIVREILLRFLHTICGRRLRAVSRVCKLFYIFFLDIHSGWNLDLSTFCKYDDNNKHHRDCPEKNYWRKSFVIKGIKHILCGIDGSDKIVLIPKMWYKQRPDVYYKIK